MHNEFAAWEAGELPATTALRVIYAELAEIERQVKALDTARAELRDQLSVIVAHEGDAVTLEGVATLRLTAPSQRVSYPTKEVESAIAEIVAYAPEAAQHIAQLRKVTHVAGTLRIEPVKVKP
jgi:hypothetical protein